MPPGDYYGSWRAMDEFSANGKIRAAGVCNFLPELLDGLCRNTDTIPAVSRVEMRPFFRQDGAGMMMYGEQIALRKKNYPFNISFPKLGRQPDNQRLSEH